MDSSRAVKWLRRAVTIPGLIVLSLVDLAALPALLLGAVVVDVARRRRFAAVRFHLAVAFALAIHVLGLLLLFRAWLAGVFGGRARERQLDVRTEVWWATATWHAAVRLFGMHVAVEGEDVLEGGPIILMSRHASLLDVLLPVVFASGPHGLALRYVGKRELLWDPFVDFVGHRLPSAFVQRHSVEHDADIARVEALAQDLGPGDGVVIFPEGTRFTESKRIRALAALADHDEAAFARAARLKNLLPPHPSGPLGLLEHATNADVVFCAHTGLEGANHLRDLSSGSLIDATVHVRFWRVAAHNIPTDEEARIDWLWQWWERIDAWLESHRAEAHSQERALAP